MSRAASFLVDIPSRWEPRAKQSRTVALLTALCAAALFESCTATTKKVPRPFGLGTRGGTFSTALEPEPFIPDTAEDSTNHGEYGESPRFWHSR